MCCPLDRGDGEPAAFHVVTTPKARKEHECCECRDVIPVGAVHENVRAKWDFEVRTLRTCLLCVEIRTHFACGHGWTYEFLWEQLADNFFPNMRAGGPCMKGLSAAAKARLFERCLKWKERFND